MEKLLTVSEVAPEAGFSEQALYDAIRKKQFPAIRIGKRIRIPESALQRWIDDQLIGSTQLQPTSASSEAE